MSRKTGFNWLLEFYKEELIFAVIALALVWVNKQKDKIENPSAT
jgi:hypothetical protein